MLVVDLQVLVIPLAGYCPSGARVGEHTGAVAYLREPQTLGGKPVEVGRFIKAVVRTEFLPAHVIDQDKDNVRRARFALRRRASGAARALTEPDVIMSSKKMAGAIRTFHKFYRHRDKLFAIATSTCAWQSLQA